MTTRPGIKPGLVFYNELGESALYLFHNFRLDIVIYGYPVVFPPRAVFFDEAFMAQFFSDRIKKIMDIFLLNGLARGQEFFYSVGCVETPYYMRIEFSAAVFLECHPKMVFIYRASGIPVNKNKR